MNPSDEFFMKEALEEAHHGFLLGEVPVGAVIVKEGKIIARAHNSVEATHNASSHAELECMRQAAALLGNWRLQGCTLYCTLEPCAMCAGAMLLFRLEKLVWGAADLRHGAHGSWIDLFGKRHPMHSLEIVSGILAEESAQLMRAFFQERREERNHARQPT